MTSTPRPQAFALFASDHGPLIVNRNDEHRMALGTRYGVGSQIFHNGCYDPEEIVLVKQELDALHTARGLGVIAIDCGANIGVHTVECAKHMTSWGHVIAFEPQERLFYALAGNIALNNCFNANARLAAVGAKNGTLRIPQPNYLLPGSFGSLELRRRPTTEFIGQCIDYSETAGVDVPLVALDSFALVRLDFIKIDVEGMEAEVLQGARETIARCRPTILIEWVKSGQAALTRALREFGYGTVQCGGNLLARPLDE